MMAPEDSVDIVPYVCWKKGAQCCKAGKIFLTMEEVLNIAQSLTLDKRKEFLHRLDQHIDFSIYDQRDGCQFLDKDNFCTLHDKKLKPAECRWWPLRAYVVDGKVEVRVAECECASFLTGSSSEQVKACKREIEKIGEDRIRRFRGIFPDTQPTISLKED